MIPYAPSPCQQNELPPADGLPAFRRDPVAFLRDAAAAQGDIARFALGGRDVILVSRPDAIRDVLVAHASSFKKGPGLGRARALLGDGLLTTEPPMHTQSRDRLRPAFARDAVGGYIPEMRRAIDDSLDGLIDGEAIDIGQAMARLTLAVASRCLFGVDLASRSGAISAAVADSLTGLYDGFRQQAHAAGRSERYFRLQSAKISLADLIRNALAPRTYGCPYASRPIPNALRSLSAEQADEEALTVLLAAYESLSIALTWTIALLASRPNTVERLRSEARQAQRSPEDPPRLAGSPPLPEEREGFRSAPQMSRVLPPALEPTFPLGGPLPPETGGEGGLAGGRHELTAPGQGRGVGDSATRNGTAGIAAQMPYARAVLAEAMRLYPPAWLLTREALFDVTLSGELAIAKRTIVLVAPCVMHVDDRYWPSPFEFRPERWLTGKPQPAACYLPFGMGPRNCIGEQFAWTEGVLALSAMYSRFSIQLECDELPAWEPLINLRPAAPILGRVRTATYS